jgi:predicted site-specific integrase-resolvase
MIPSTPAMLPKNSAAALLGVSVNTLNQMIGDGLIDTISLRNRVYVTRSSVTELISHTSNPRNLNTVLKAMERRLDHLAFLVEQLVNADDSDRLEVGA